MEQVSNHCYAVLNEKNRVCDANSGFVNVGGGMVVDTQSDLAHARQMIELFDTGTGARDAARKIDFGPYSEWVSPERIYLNVERAYREFRGEPPDKPWDQAKTFDEIYGVARKQGLAPTF